jgi:DNA-binding response OmpR family regulator
MRILVVEDNRDIHDNLIEFLTLKGHEVHGALSGLAGLNLAATRPFDAILLDVMLPGIDGNQICHSLRHHSRSNVAIVMLSARDQLADRLAGFDVGADDYITKPFAMSEALARLEAVVSRRTRRGTRALQVADLHYDLDTYEVTRGGRLLKLNPTHLKILDLLMRRSPGTVRRQELEDLVWGRDVPASDSLRSNIHLLRRVMDKDFATPLLHTVHGTGYKLAE